MIPHLLAFEDLGLLVIRIVLGVILIAHGWPKAKDQKSTAEYFKSINLKFPSLLAKIAAAVECGGGFLIAVGLATQIAALFVFLQFLIVILFVKRGQKLINGYELDLLMAASALVLVFSGSGLKSLDSFLGIMVY